MNLVDRKLTYSQIKRLYQFTRQHFVVYVDVQRIFVKELAEGIKAQWEQDHTIDFETALQKQFKTYGVYGFSDRNNKIVSQLQSFYLKTSASYSLKHLLKPEILGCFIIAGLLYFLFFTLNWQAYYLFGFSIAIIGLSIYLSITHRKKLNQSQQNRSANLINETVKTGGNASSFTLLFIQFPLQAINRADSNSLAAELFLLCFYLVLLAGVYVMYISYKKLPKKTKFISKLLQQKLKTYQKA